MDPAFLPLILGVAVLALILITAHVSTYRFERRKKSVAKATYALSEAAEPTFFEAIGAQIIVRRRDPQFYGGGEAVPLTPKSFERT